MKSLASGFSKSKRNFFQKAELIRRHRYVRETFMETDLRFASTLADAQSAVSWGAIAAGAVGTAALALLLIAFGAGLGLSAVSPWSDSGVSASTFRTGTGIYLVIVAVMSSAVGGYLAARLRSKWVGLHSHEVFFRDTAHGFIAWAFATLLSAGALSSTATYLANGTAAGLGGAASQATSSVNPADVYVDKLFRPNASAQPASAPDAGNATRNQSRAEVLRLWTASFHDNQDLNAADKTYVAQVVAARTGMSSSRRRETRQRHRRRSKDRRRRCAQSRRKAFVLADRGHVVRSIRGKPRGGRRRLAARRHLE